MMPACQCFARRVKHSSFDRTVPTHTKERIERKRKKKEGIKSPKGGAT